MVSEPVGQIEERDCYGTDRVGQRRVVRRTGRGTRGWGRLLGSHDPHLSPGDVAAADVRSHSYGFRVPRRPLPWISLGTLVTLAIRHIPNYAWRRPSVTSGAHT